VSKSIRVLIADDHAPTRADIREVLAADPRFSVCAEAHDAPGAVEAAVRTLPDLCLLDVRMPGGGIAASWEICARLPRTKVVMLTVSLADSHLFAALRAGASSYLLKDFDASRLPGALVDVLAGDASISGKLVARMVEEFRDRGSRMRPTAGAGDGGGAAGRLTSREWEVLDLLRKGHTTAEIAGHLFLSQATIRSHIAATLKKLGVPDRESAIRLFAEG
jgi:two-component system NarL family response regulator